MSGRLIHSSLLLKTWGAILIGLLVVLVPILAEAKKGGCPGKPKNKVRARRMAKKYFTKGGKLAQKGKNVLALDSFLCSLKMKPHENTVYNVAQVSKFVEDRELVRKRLQGFIDKYPKHESRAELEELISSVDGTYTPPDENAPIDEEIPPAVAGTEPAGDAGDIGPPAPEAEQEPEAEDGAEDGAEEQPDEEVAALFAEDEQAAAEEGGGAGEAGEIEEAEEPADEPQPPPERDRAPPTKIAGYVLLGVAGATLITAIGLQGATGAAKNDALEAQNYEQFTTREDKMSRLQTGATVFWVATGVLAGTGIVLLLLDSGEREDGSSGVQVEVGAAPAGIAVGGRF